MVFRSLATFQSYWQSALKGIRNPNALVQSATGGNPATLVQRARNISRAQLVAGGVVAAECLGFFTVGEMLGRFKVVGYHGEVHHEEH